jgi:hypothetical protein
VPNHRRTVAEPQADVTRRASIRLATGHLTSVAQPSFSNAQMTRAVEST